MASARHRSLPMLLIHALRGMMHAPLNVLLAVLMHDGL
jgi:hypothetical protein